MINTSPFREYVIGVDTRVPLNNGKLATYINFDNAATTPPLKNVMKAINEFAPWYSSIHRGKGYKSLLSSHLYEESRKSILNFVNGDPEHDTVIFVKNTTEAINKLSYRLANKEENQVVLSTEMEHHSNDLPWRRYYNIDYINVNTSGRLSLADLEAKLINYKGKVKLVTITGASNVTGYINPIYEVAKLAHKYRAKILVDGAQLIPHHLIDMKPVGSENHIDYLVFSAHKMYAPFGTGVLIGPKNTFFSGDPELVGGGTVEIVTHDYVSWDKPPHKEEAGSPNLMGVIALTEAIKTLTKLGMQKISNYENKLASYTLEKLKKIKDIKIYVNDMNNKEKVGIIPFNLQKLSHELVATALANEAGIAVRNGCFCAQPYIQRLLSISKREVKRRIRNPNLPHPGLVRISFGMYNTKEEVDILVNLLTKMSQDKRYYYYKYKNSS